MAAIKAVLFDVDGVLLDSFEGNLKFHQDLMLASNNRPPTREEFKPMFHLTLRDSIKKIVPSISENDLEKAWLLGKNRVVRYPIELLSLPDGAKETLFALAKKYSLGIVSSRFRNSVFEFPKLAEMKALFKVTVAYEDTANHKPHPEPLLLACSRLEVNPENAVYIGDTETDVKASNAAGMHSVAYSGLFIPGADKCTDSFKELPRIIETL